MSSLDYLDLCRLCLVKDCVSTPIFGGEGDVRQIFLKIAACLPVKVAKEDKLPKKICNDCVYKVELCYDFWNTTANSEKQLLQWLGGSASETKQNYASDGRSSQSVLKSEGSSGNRLGGPAINNMGIGIMDNIGLGVPMMISSNNQQQISSVPMDTSSNSVQTSQAVPGPSSQTARENAANPTTQDEEEISTEDEENSDDDNDAEGLPVKEESEEDANSSRNIEPTTFVNVSLACDEAGPSGLQRQKIAEIPEMTIPQTVEGDPKSGYYVRKHETMQRKKERQRYEPEEKDMLRETETDLLNEDDFKSEDTEMIMQCTECGDTFVNEDKLRLHLKNHEEESRAKEEEMGEEVEEEILHLEMEAEDGDEDDPPMTVTDDSYVCEHCGSCYETAHKLITHQRVHTSNNSNADSGDFDYKYQCDSCGIILSSHEEYQDHQEVHEQEKPFQCDICQATFRYRQGLRLHTKLHQPDYVPPQKKHHCELCNKRFSRKQVLLVHMKTHGNVGPQSEYICPICSKAVSSKTYLTVHLRKHTGEKPHVCDLCGKGFISQNYLSVHRRTHTGERPHKCTHCEKSFTQRTTLVVHLRGHTGDRPYPCSFCIKSFASKTMLNSHLKTHAKQTARQQQEQRQQQSSRGGQQQEGSLENVTFILPS